MSLLRPLRVRVALAATLFIGLFVGSLVGGTALASHSFDDVGNNNLFHDDITWLAEQGITDGYSDGGFHPSAPVTRQAMAAYLQRYNTRIVTVQKTENPPPGESVSLVLQCPAGTEVIGGGGGTSSAELVMSDSFPLNTVQWTVRWTSRNSTSVDATSARIFATCRPELL